MKPMLLAIFFLIVIISGSLLSMYYISHQSEALQKQLVELERHIDSENWVKAKSLYNDFNHSWAKIDHIWSMLIDHYEIDYINTDLGELEAYIKTKDKADALAKISSLQWLVRAYTRKRISSSQKHTIIIYSISLFLKSSKSCSISWGNLASNFIIPFP